MRHREIKSSNIGLQRLRCDQSNPHEQCPRCGEQLVARPRPRINHRGHRLGTISSLMRQDQEVPMLRLSGKWLAKHGFEVGQGIEIDVEQGKLTIMIDTDRDQETGPAVA